MHPEIYKRFGDKSIVYLNEKIVKVTQRVRELEGSSVIINNWHTGGNFINSGVRDYLNPHRSGSRSRHYYGVCADLKFKRNSKEVYNDIIIPNLEELMSLGLTTVEDIEYTKGKDGKNGWLHLSVEWTGKDELVIVKP